MEKIMKLLKHLKLSLLSVALFGSAMSQAIDVIKADSQYATQDYSNAMQGYLEASQVGNPYAMYQLGTMYHKGQGVAPDPLNALIYYAMAAEYDFQNSKSIVETMLSNLSAEHASKIRQIIEQDLVNKGKAYSNTRYLPNIIEENLAYKITFDGEPSLPEKYYSDDFDNIIDIDDNNPNSSFYRPLSNKYAPFLIVENEVAADGSARNLIDIQKTGNTQKLTEDYILFPGPVPKFKGQPINFVHRSKMGLAATNKFTILENNEPLYEGVLKKTKTLKTSDNLNDRFLYAVSLQNFDWITKDKTLAEQAFLELAELGHPGAMFEYGSMLYRQQRDIKTAIHWISEASKYGLGRAEYRLGTILMDSPWVERDEEKALFWFQSASQKGNNHAALKAIEIQLTANNLSLRNPDATIEPLEIMQDEQSLNPEYFYLQALSYKDRTDRDFAKAIENLEKAIFMASNRNWDVSEWQDLLLKLTQGNVYITDNQA
jgi:TPR repeat protein